MRWVVPVLLFAVLGCGNDASEGDGEGTDAGGSGEPATLTHTFPAFDVAPGEELWRYCQSWTLGNTEPLYVNRVTAANGGGWHHSNWLFVRESAFPGPDGTWVCRDRGYDEVSAGLNGGVFFAQSTQALTETQAFPPGVAVRIPPRARILGGTHLLNATPEALSTAIRFEVETIPEDEVHTRLQPMSFTYDALAIPPRAQSRFSMDCDIGTPYADRFGRAPDFRIYYVLPHYHALGNYFRLELVGGERDGEVVYETGAAVGDALGSPIDPPVDVAGATAVRMICGYDNPRDETVYFGIGDDEMCVMLAFTDSPLRFAGYGDSDAHVGDEGDVQMHESPCVAYGLAEL